MVPAFVDVHHVLHQLTDFCYFREVGTDLVQLVPSRSLHVFWRTVESDVLWISPCLLHQGYSSVNSAGFVEAEFHNNCCSRTSMLPVVTVKVHHPWQITYRLGQSKTLILRHRIVSDR